MIDNREDLDKAYSIRAGLKKMRQLLKENPSVIDDMINPDAVVAWTNWIKAESGFPHFDQALGHYMDKYGL